MFTLIENCTMHACNQIAWLTTEMKDLSAKVFKFDTSLIKMMSRKDIKKAECQAMELCMKVENV